MFKYEEPTIDRKQDAIDYVNELKEYNSGINGTSGLDKYLDDYEGWQKIFSNVLNKLFILGVLGILYLTIL